MPSGRAPIRHYKLSLGDAIESHKEALKFGPGLAGVRDWNLVQSAIGRPYDGYHRRIYEKAAALLHSIVKNHGFVDGNKRTSVLLVGILLDRSGYLLMHPTVDPYIEIGDLVVGIAGSTLTYEDAVQWFRERVRK